MQRVCGSRALAQSCARRSQRFRRGGCSIARGSNEPRRRQQTQAGNDGLRERSATTGGAASVEQIERARSFHDPLQSCRRRCSLPLRGALRLPAARIGHLWPHLILRTPAHFKLISAHSARTIQDAQKYVVILAHTRRNAAKRSPELIFLLQKGSIDRVERDKREISPIFEPIRDFGGPV